MPKYINADEVLLEESEAYTKLKQSVSNDINNDISAQIIIRYVRKQLQQLLDDVPAADVAPVVHGEWISNDLGGYKWAFHCSLCGFVDGYPFNDRFNFCPQCGAKMEVADPDKS